MRPLESIAVRVALLAALAQTSGCGNNDKQPPALNALRQPSGLALTPEGRWLFVTGGNWDQARTGGTLLALDMDAVHAALAGDVQAVGDPLSRARPCRRSADGQLIVCAESAFVASGATVIAGSGLGNIAVDRPSGPDGPVRLLVPQRVPAALAWFDVTTGPRGLEIDCGQQEDRVCDAEHRVRRTGGNTMQPDPSRVVVDDQGFRFAYVPHLRGGALTLIDLDGDQGPELSNLSDEFFREGELEGLSERGGFAVAARACDPMRAAASAMDCARPLMYATHRYWPGLREFTVAPGLEVIVPGSDTPLEAIGTENVLSRPLLGDLAFEDPQVGDSLLVVQTTPGALVRVDTTLDEDGDPHNTIVAQVALCSNPNVLAIHRPPDAEPLALVSCFSDGEVVAVALTTFNVVATIPTGAGANEISIDRVRKQAYVANTRDSTISLIELDPRSPRYLTHWARLGL